MPGVFLTVDLGNSRLKLRCWSSLDAREPLADLRWDLNTGVELVDALAAALERIGAIECAALASVAEPAVEARVVDCLRASLGPRLRIDLDPGLDVRVREPARVGRDRLCAARGAFEELARSAIVVDAGTCITVDALAVDDRGRPSFLGGAIAPGPALLRDALARGGARLFEVDLRSGVPALGRDTAEALRAGIVVGARGMVRGLVDAVAAEAGLASAPVCFTGGAALLLELSTQFGARAAVHVPELVHRGLLAALRDDARRST